MGKLEFGRLAEKMRGRLTCRIAFLPIDLHLFHLSFFIVFFFICDFFQPVIGLPIGNVQVEELVMTCSISNFLTTLPTSSLTTNYSAARCLAASFNLSTFNLSKVLAFEQIWEIANWRLPSATSSIASFASSFFLRWLATSSMITGALPGLSIPFLICISGKSHSQADSARHWPKVADTYWLCSCWYRTDPVSFWLSALVTLTLGGRDEHRVLQN